MAALPVPADPQQVAMVAGETSGDLLAALLFQGMRARWPALQGVGIGGSHMVAQGFDAWWPSERLAVRGYVEVLRHYRGIVAIRRQLRDRLLAQPPSVFVGVDAPDFNLDLEADLKATGVKTVHFVAPAIWAWRPERAAKIRRSVDHVLCVFPFEPELLAQHGIPATYVGHPLAPHIPLVPDRSAARARLGLPDGVQVLAVMPGSRRAEIDHLLPRFLAATQLLRQDRPGLRVVLPAVPALWDRIQQLVQASGLAPHIQVLRGDAHTALAACDATLIASGTATLEAALFKRPMVIAYHMNPLSWFITQRKRLQPWVGLPNILAQDFVVPELLQNEATPVALARAMAPWLDAAQTDPGKLAALTQRFTEMHHTLRRDTAGLAVHAIETVLAG